MTTIIGIKIDDRKTSAQKVQETLTEYGCIIRSRLGLHAMKNQQCTQYGIILLEVTDDEQAISLESELSKIENVQLQKMLF